MSSLVDYMLDLYRNPDAAQAFIDDPNKALSDAGFPNVTPAQLQAVAVAAAPANVELSGGDPFSAVQQAVAEIHRPEPADDRFSVGYSPAEFDESAGPGPEDSVDPVGGESLLLPYFEVDLDETAGPTTIESAPEPTDAEAWAQTQAQADGRFGVGFDATREAGPTGIEPIEPAPGGETVLLPYFEADLDETAGPTTIESAPEPTDAEAWAQTQAQADGRFGVGFDATREAGPTGIEPIEPAPGGETVLLPYFEADLDETAGPTTIESAPEPTDAEAWAQTQAQADGRFGVGFDARGEAPAPPPELAPAPAGQTAEDVPDGVLYGDYQLPPPPPVEEPTEPPPDPSTYGMDIIG